MSLRWPTLAAPASPACAPSTAPSLNWGSVGREAPPPGPLRSEAPSFKPDRLQITWNKSNKSNRFVSKHNRSPRSATLL
eukprot:966831-Pyramimonas_sp.AAC.1